MNTESKQIEVSSISVTVVRKKIKNLHLAVYPPDGRVRIAVPLHLNDEAVRLAVVTRLGWIRKQQQKLLSQIRQSQREMVTGESHYYRGRRYRLDVTERNGSPVVSIKNNRVLKLIVRPNSDCLTRSKVLQEWYRNALKNLIPELLTKWQPIVGVHVDSVRVRKMKTRWGTCSIQTRMILLNLELIKKPIECIEYILVHEMVHLHERHHNDTFIALMDQFMPQWRMYRQELNRSPLVHEDWKY